MISYFSEGNYVCPGCGRSYKYKSTMNRHRRYECNKKGTHICPLCQKVFKHKHNMETHLFTVHDGVLSKHQQTTKEELEYASWCYCMLYIKTKAYGLKISSRKIISHWYIHIFENIMCEYFNDIGSINSEMFIIFFIDSYRQ